MNIGKHYSSKSCTMLCKVCREGLQGIWDPSRTRRVCRVDAFMRDEATIPDSKFVTVEPYLAVEPCDPESLRPELYMFGHHLTRESFERSISNGCVMCNIFKPLYNGDVETPNPKITALGYYSLFSISF